MQKATFLILCIILFAGSLTAYAERRTGALRSDEDDKGEEVIEQLDVYYNREQTENPMHKSENHDLEIRQIKKSAGRYWGRIDNLSRSGEPYVAVLGKAALLRGIYEGAWTVDPMKAEKMYHPDVKYGGLIAMVDAFYGDDRNSGIPVSEALKILSMRLRGNGEDEINHALNEMRLNFTTH